jgi:hydrogenase expression/formation protein HypC
MCLSIPAKVLTVGGDETALVSVQGVELTISLQLVEGIREGDYVLVHTGFALQKLSEEEAQASLQLLKELGELGEESFKSDSA